MIRGITLAVILALTCGGIYFLPGLQQTESALNIDIPERIGSWTTAKYPASEAELRVLAKDTEFSKAHCYSQRTEEMPLLSGGWRIDVIDLGIVVSGYDLANSIHRPERCMAAQGHYGLLTSKTELEIVEDRVIPLSQIVSKKNVKTQSGESIPVDFLTYYFFVGHDSITEDHTERTVTDIIDRVAKGEAQRWAYITVGLPFTDDENRKSGDPLLTMEQAEEKIQEVLKDFAATNIDWDKISL